MDANTVKFLNSVNAAFYECVHETFSETRNAPWEGWSRVFEAVSANWSGYATPDRDTLADFGQESSSTLQNPSSELGSSGFCETECRITAPIYRYPPVFSALDVACGNLRFEKCLIDYADKIFGEEERGLYFRAHAVDSCDELALSGDWWQTQGLDVCDQRSFRQEQVRRDLAGEHCAALASEHGKVRADGARARKVARSDRLELTYSSCDVVSSIATGSSLAHQFGAQPFDLAVSFGFMHHIPSFDLRLKFLRDLITCVHERGLVAVSLWRFMRNDKLAAKALASHERALAAFGDSLDCAQLECGDYFLGWQHESHVFRYCHHFDAEEIELLCEGVSDIAQTIDVFDADGRTGDLNTYIILRRL